MKITAKLLIAFLILGVSCQTTKINKMLNEDRILLQENMYPWLSIEIYKLVALESVRQKIDYRFILALIQAESEGNVFARSPKGAIGLMQVMPKWHWKGLPVKELYTPKNNIRVGCAYLGWCFRWSQNNIVETLRCYNVGPMSKFYNWLYINKIIKLYKNSVMLKKFTMGKIDANINKVHYNQVY